MLVVSLVIKDIRAPWLDLASRITRWFAAVVEIHVRSMADNVATKIYQSGPTRRRRRRRHPCFR